MKRMILTLSALVLALALAACATGPQLVYSADLTTAAEIPTPTVGDATPSGSATATLNADETELVVSGSFEGLTGAATGAHIHGPAAEDETASVVFPLSIDDAQSGDFSGTWSDITPAQVEQLRDGLFYVNVHTAQNPAGEIRGQLE